jgi:hypothetical protein
MSTNEQKAQKKGIFGRLQRPELLIEQPLEAAWRFPRE